MSDTYETSGKSYSWKCLYGWRKSQLLKVQIKVTMAFHKTRIQEAVAPGLVLFTHIIGCEPSRYYEQTQDLCDLSMIQQLSYSWIFYIKIWESSTSEAFNSLQFIFVRYKQNKISFRISLCIKCAISRLNASVLNISCSLGHVVLLTNEFFWLNAYQLNLQVSEYDSYAKRVLLRNHTSWTLVRFEQTKRVTHFFSTKSFKAYLSKSIFLGIVGIKQLQGRHNVSQNAVTKINSNVSTPVPIYTKSMVQENLTAARMDSRDSLNRLNPVDDNK